jgi:hypothetical protein
MKCELFRTTSEYLGHLVTPSCLSALPSKLSAVASWPQPSNIRDIRQFLGSTGFYRHFIANYATIAVPLTDLLGSKLGTGAPDFAIGAVLQQDHGKCFQPIAFLSCKLTTHQVRYPVHEKELFATMEALRVWRQHLQGASFMVQVLTDHVTLTYFMTQPKLSSRQVRWSEPVANFDLTISYKPGKDIVPDALFWQPDLKLLFISSSFSSPHWPRWHPPST